jgi:hypothetical protein
VGAKSTGRFAAHGACPPGDRVVHITSAWSAAALRGLETPIVQLGAAKYTGLANAPLGRTLVTVHGDCPNFRGELRENGTVPFGGKGTTFGEAPAGDSGTN